MNRFTPDVRWSDERAAVEFGIGIGEYEGVVHIYPGGSSNGCSIRLRHPSGALKPTICNGPGLN
jgi:hypothetical protein